MKIGSKIEYTYWGEPKRGTVTEVGSSFVWVKEAETGKVRWFHKSSVREIA